MAKKHGFYGDVFDVTMKFSPWLAKLGAIGHDFLNMTNNLVNCLCILFALARISLSLKSQG